MQHPCLILIFIIGVAIWNPAAGLGLGLAVGNLVTGISSQLGLGRRGGLWNRVLSQL